MRRSLAEAGEARVCSFSRGAFLNASQTAVARSVRHTGAVLAHALASAKHPDHRLTLVGHSYGALVAPLVAAEAQAAGTRIDALVLVDGAPLVARSEASARLLGQLDGGGGKGARFARRLEVAALLGALRLLLLARPAEQATFTRHLPASLRELAVAAFLSKDTYEQVCCCFAFVAVFFSISKSMQLNQSLSPVDFLLCAAGNRLVVAE